MNIPDPANTILTHRQWEILELRSRGLSTTEIARIIGTGKQNVLVLENRARRKIARARFTIDLLDNMGRESISYVRSGTHVLDAVKGIITEADQNGIRISGNLVDVLNSLRKNCGNWIDNGILTRDVSVSIFSDGSYTISPVTDHGRSR